jgi:hypothetical protein
MSSLSSSQETSRAKSTGRFRSLKRFASQILRPLACTSDVDFVVDPDLGAARPVPSTATFQPADMQLSQLAVSSQPSMRDPYFVRISTEIHSSYDSSSTLSSRSNRSARSHVAHPCALRSWPSTPSEIVDGYFYLNDTRSSSDSQMMEELADECETPSSLGHLSFDSIRTTTSPAISSSSARSASALSFVGPQCSRHDDTLKLYSTQKRPSLRATRSMSLGLTAAEAKKIGASWLSDEPVNLGLKCSASMRTACSGLSLTRELRRKEELRALHSLQRWESVEPCASANTSGPVKRWKMKKTTSGDQSTRAGAVLCISEAESNLVSRWNRQEAWPRRSSSVMFRRIMKLYELRC